MNRVVAVLAMVVAGACQDPTIDVAITVPDAPRDYAGAVATMTVRVLAPSDGATDCDTIAFGELDDDAIELAQVTSVSLRDDRGAIDGVPRTGRKLFLAEGRNEDGVAIVAGCTERVDDIDDDVTVTIATVPTVVIAVDGPDADEPVPATPIDVTIDDGLGVPAPIEGREVRWDVYGAASEHLTGAPGAYVSDADGEVAIEVDAPSGAGPASIQVRARWARNQPVVLPAFQEPPAVDLSVNRTCTGDADDTLEVATDSWQSLRLADGRFALIGMARDTTRTHLYVAAWDGEGTADACSDDLDEVTTFAVLRATDDDPVDRILTMTRQEWIEHEIVAASGAISLVERRRTAWTTSPPPNPPAAIVTVRDCDTGSPAQDYVLAQFNDGTVVALADAAIVAHPFAAAINDHLGELAVGPLLPRISRAGCIAQQDLDLALPALFFHAPRGEDGTQLLPRFLVVDDPVDHFTGLVVPSFGAVAFTPVATEVPLLLGGTFDPSGARVVRWRLTPGDDGLDLREVHADDAAGPPASIAIGDLDGDALVDTVWGLVDAVPGGVQEARMQVSLGCGANGFALNSLSRPIASSAAAMFLAPEPDGTADIAVGGSRVAIFLDPDAL